MIHQPQRMVKLGYSLKSGAVSLAINGGVQIASRLSVGIVLSTNFVSVIKLSQISKLLLCLSTFISALHENLALHHGYMFIMGAFGGFLNTTDIILLKDCLQDGRQIGLSIFIFVDALSTTMATTAAGYLVDFSVSYQSVFVSYGACFGFSSILVILMGFNMRRTSEKAKDADDT